MQVLHIVFGAYCWKCKATNMY